MKAKNIFLLIFLIMFSYSNLFPQQFTWYERNSPVNTRLNGIDLNLYPFIFWMCGNNGVVLKTRNEGVTFINLTGKGIPLNVNLVSICPMVDTNIALAAGFRNDTTFVYRTSNGGYNWILNFTQAGGFINAVVKMFTGMYSNSPIGFMSGNPVGNRWSLWRTTNAGASWDSTGKYVPRAGSETSFPGSLFYRDSNVWFGTNNARIYRSTNHGNTWSIQYPAGEQNPSALNFAYGYSSALYGDAAGSSTFQYTNNGGVNWINPNIPLPGSGRILSIVGHVAGVDYSLSDEWFVRNDNKIYHHPGGSGWNAHYTASSGNYIYMSGAPNYVWIGAVRDNGGITFCNCQIWGAVRNLGGVIPKGYSLNQNYPNPFNPATTIGFSVPVKSFTTINIYNALGAYITSIVNQELPAGNYDIIWDAGKYASGIYYYNLTADNYSVTNKMVLVK